MTSSSRAFIPPGPEQVRGHLEHHGPVARDPWRAWLPLVLLAAALVISATVEAVWAGALPWVAIGTLLVLTTSRARRAQRLARQLTQLQELVMLRHYVPALRLAWRSLPYMASIPAFHGRTVAFLSYGLDQVGAYDAAIVGYDYMIDRLPPAQLGSQQMRIARSIAQLNNSQLADADLGLRSVRRQVAAGSVPPIQASLRFAALLQQVRTNHFVEAVEGADTLQEELQPLGIEAGYGHALMALACHMQQPGTGQPDDVTASSWWSKATMLLSPTMLTARFPELREVANLYPAAPSLTSVLSPNHRGDSA